MPHHYSEILALSCTRALLALLFYTCFSNHSVSEEHSIRIGVGLNFSIGTIFDQNGLHIRGEPDKAPTMFEQPPSSCFSQPGVTRINSVDIESARDFYIQLSTLWIRGNAIEIFCGSESYAASLLLEIRDDQGVWIVEDWPSREQLETLVHYYARQRARLFSLSRSVKDLPGDSIGIEVRSDTNDLMYVIAINDGLYAGFFVSDEEFLRDAVIGAISEEFDDARAVELSGPGYWTVFTALPNVNMLAFRDIPILFEKIDAAWLIKSQAEIDARKRSISDLENALEQLRRQ